MIRLLLLWLSIIACFQSFGANITIIESQSNSGQNMDTRWAAVAAGMGHTATIRPQTTLDNSTFFATTDVLIIASGVLAIPVNRRNTILQFMQSGKSVYLQSEYLATYDGNQTFSFILSSLGATFGWGGTVNGDLAPVNVIGTFANTNVVVSPLSYYWYSVNGIGDCNTVNFLEQGGLYHGFQYVPINPAFGSIITTTDQDWVNSNTSPQLQQNIITHLLNSISVNPNAIGLGNDTTLCNGATLQLNATQTGATYLWQDNSTNATYTVTQPGTYYVRVTNTCTVVSDTIVVAYSVGAPLSLGNDTILCAGASLALDATEAGATYLWQDNSTASTFTVTQAGTYWVRRTTASCGALTDTIVINYGTVGSVNIGNDTTLCSGATLVLTATTPNATYLWQDNSTAPTFTVTQAGTYSVQVTSNCGAFTDNIVITYSAPVTIELGNDTNLCPGATLTLDATALNATYLWQDNSTAPTYTVTQAGTYSVQVATSCGVLTDNIVINYTAPTVVDLGNDTIICAGSPLILDATTPNATYVWQDNSTAATYNVTQPGTYSVQVTAACNVVTDNIVVGYVNPGPNTVELGNDTILCTGQTLLLDATVVGASYTWQDNSTAASYTVTQPGTYGVTVVTACGTVTDNIIVTYFTPSALVLGNDTSLCPGATLTLDATTPNATYLWQNNSTAPTQTVTQAGTYTVQATTLCGVLTEDIVVVYTAPVILDLGNDTTLCPGVTLTLDATALNATYLWQDNSTAPTITVTQAGTYSVQLTTNCGVLTDNIVIDYTPPVVVNLGNDTSLCPSATLTLDATTPNATYLWQNNSTAATLTVTQAGTYLVQVTTNCGVFTDDIVVVYTAPVILDLGNDTTLCPGATLTLDAAALNATYLWQDNSTAPTITITQAGTYNVQVTTGCGTLNDNIAITYDVPPSVNLGNDTLLCPGVTLPLDATFANATYLWQNSDTTAVFNVTQAGTFNVSVSNACGTAADAVVVDYIAPVIVDLGNDTALCPGAALTLDATALNATYLWQDGATAAIYTTTQAGTYSVLVTTTCGTIGDEITIDSWALPTVNIGIDSIYCEGDVVVLDATSPLASSYLWHDGSVSPTLDLVESGTASVTVSNSCGTATDAVTAVFENCECYLYMPNSFTPNGDGRNDLFAPFTGCAFEGYQFSVFDRWGELVFTATSTTSLGWDGTYKGELAAPGVYVYSIKYLPNDVAKGSTEKQVKGSVTLLR